MMSCGCGFPTDGDHTRSKTVVSSSAGTGMLFKFTKKKNKCVGCRAVIDREGEREGSGEEGERKGGREG